MLFPNISAKVINLLSIFLIAFGISSFHTHRNSNDDRFVYYIVNPKEKELQFHYKDEKGNTFKSIQSLKQWLEKKNKTLLFAMNGGMYKKDNSPLGLYIENSKTISKLNTEKGYGNFYLQPNGVFYITAERLPSISTTNEFKEKKNIEYATQSGPMLVIKGKINPVFKEGSANLNIRNGVGILPGNKVILAMSKHEVNFYDFAKFFKDMGCISALYLDGFVSRTYFPEKNWIQLDGNFGVMIGIIKNKN